MSCSKWMWTPACDDVVCVGDCDECLIDWDEVDWDEEEDDG